jgi:integrase
MTVEASEKAKTRQMGFEELEQTNSKLFQNPELSEHNKEVLQDFFRKARSGGAGDAILRDYSSRFNKLAETVDFKLDEPTQKDLEKIVADFNTDRIKKNNGQKYSDYSKDKFWSTLSKFYNWFIKKEGKGYNPDIDGPELLEDLEIKVDLSVEVDPDRKPTPEEVKRVSNQADSLRNKAIILFGWATGARVGELFDTEYNDNPLRWKDLEFREDKIWVKLKGKSGEREIPVKTSKPVMEDLWDNSDASLEDPVFRQSKSKSICPECGAELNLTGSNTHLEYKRYKCPECGWEGKGPEIDKKKKPLRDHSARKILRKLVKRAGLKGEFDDNPHDFFRKSRAIYKTRVGYTEHQLRAFFGWSETSDAPKHYIALVKEDLEKAFAEEYGEEVEYDNGYDEEALRPVQCVSCDTLNSATNDLCKECGKALTEQGEELTKETSFQDFEDSLLDLLTDEDPVEDPEEIKEMMREKSFIEVLKTLKK